MYGPVNCQLLLHTVISSFSAQELMTTYTQDIHLGEDLNSWSESEQRISSVVSLTDLKPPVLSGLTASHPATPHSQDFSQGKMKKQK